MQWMPGRLKGVQIYLRLVAAPPWRFYADVVIGSSNVRNQWMETGSGSLSCMGSTCCRKKGAEWWHDQWIWEMVAHGCSSSSFWGSPGFAQLAVFVPSLSTLSSKHQQEGTSMRSNTQCCILLCILLVSQRQVRYFAASESRFCCPSAMFE